MRMLGLFAGAFALVLGAGSASAAYVDLSNFAGSSDFSASCSTNFGGCSVTSSSNGLGANGPTVFDDSNLIEGNSIYTEALTITFGALTQLDSFTLGLFGSGDSFDFAIDGGSFTNSVTTIPQIVDAMVTSFTVRATKEGSIFNPNTFTLAGFTTGDSNVAAVPLPAAGFLFAGALGGLAALRRRQKLPAA